MNRNAKIIKACIQGERGAWQDFYRTYKKYAIGAINYKTNTSMFSISKEEREEIMQEVFLSIWEKNKLEMIRDPDCIKSWIVMLSVNATVNYFRSRTYKRDNNTVSIEKNIIAEDNGISLKNLIPDIGKDVFRDVSQRELMDLCENIITFMEPKQQIVLKMGIFDKYKHKEISDILGIPINTVSSIINRGKRVLREKIGDFKKIV